MTKTKSQTISAEELVKIADKAITNFRGDFDVLESAIGMLLLGRRYGWRVIYIVHSKRTVRKYESILGINAREFFPDKSDLSERSKGYQIAKTLSNFWKGINDNVEGVRTAELVK